MLRSPVRTLLWPLEQPAVDRLAKDVPLHRFHDVRACLERIRRRLHVELDVERVDFEHVVMLRAGRGGAWSSIHRTGCADLKTAVWPLRAFRNTLGQARGARRN